MALRRRSSEMERLVLDHMWLVPDEVKNVARYAPRHVQRDDLRQSGYVGLIEAADRFDPAVGAPFGAWARLKVRGAVLDALRVRDVLGRGGRVAARGERLDALLIGHANVPLLPAPEPNERDEIGLRWLSRTVGVLTPKLRRVLSDYYFAGMTADETASLTAMSPTRVLQLRAEAIGILQKEAACLTPDCA